MKEKLLSLLLLPITLLYLPSCKQTSKCIVGVECGYPPYLGVVPKQEATNNSIMTTNGQYCSGFDATLIMNIERKLDVSFQYHMYDFDGLITGLVTNQLDLVIAGMSPTEERRKQVNFSINYYNSKQVLIVKNNSDLMNAKSLNDFSFKKIIAQSGTLQDTLIDQIPNVVKMTSLNEMIMLIQSIKNSIADGMIAEYVVAKTIINKNPDLALIDLGDNGFFIADGEESTAIAVNKKQVKLLNQINSIIESIDEAEKNRWLDEAIESLLS